MCLCIDLVVQSSTGCLPHVPNPYIYLFPAKIFRAKKLPFCQKPKYSSFQLSNLKAVIVYHLFTLHVTNHT